MDTEQSTLRNLQPPIDNHPPSDIIGSHHHLHDDVDAEGEGTSSNSIPSGVGDVPDRMSSEKVYHQKEDDNGVTTYYPYLDNNDVSGTTYHEFISVDLISNCQEESIIQLADSSSIDNNSNVSEISIDDFSGLTRNLQPIIILDEDQSYIQTFIE